MAEEGKTAHSDGVIAKKLAAIREAVLDEHPTSDIETMLAEIDRGYEVDLEFQS